VCSLGVASKVNRVKVLWAVIRLLFVDVVYGKICRVTEWDIPSEEFTAFSTRDALTINLVPKDDAVISSNSTRCTCWVVITYVNDISAGVQVGATGVLFKVANVVITLLIAVRCSPCTVVLVVMLSAKRLSLYLWFVASFNLANLYCCCHVSSITLSEFQEAPFHRV
jgi:hypothetical protein